LALIQSGEPIGGTAEPQGIAATCHAVAKLPSGLAGCVHPNNAVDCVIVVAVKVFGLVQVGGGPQVTLAFHPAATPDPSDVNTKVKQPEAVVDVKGPGIAVPENVPNKVPVATSPSYTLKKSNPVSVANELKVTVTTCPGIEGQIVVVPVAAVILLV
jgi:hypothetical protein